MTRSSDELRRYLVHASPAPWREAGGVLRNGTVLPFLVSKTDEIGGQPVAEMVSQSAIQREADACLVRYLVNNAEVFAELLDLAEIVNGPTAKAVAALQSLSNAPIRQTRGGTMKDSLQEHADDHTKHDYIHVTRTDLGGLQARIAALEEALSQFPGGLIEDGPQPRTGMPTRYLMVRAEDYKRWRDGVDVLLDRQNTASADRG